MKKIALKNLKKYLPWGEEGEQERERGQYIDQACAFYTALQYYDNVG